MPRKPAHHYRVAIPSYQRPTGLDTKTLPLLTLRGVDPDRITVYIHAHDPHQADYTTVAQHHGVHLRTTDEHGITAQRQRITHDHPAGQPIVSMDDDLTDIVRALDSKTLDSIGDVDAWFRDMFTDTAGHDLHTWGINPVANAYFMKPGQLSDGLRFLMFCCYGFFNRPGHPVNTSTVPTKDDYEYSLRAWWWDGGVLRADGVAPRADIYTAPGGCQGTRTPAHSEEATRSLMAQWPGLVKRNTRRKSTYTEILLAPKKRHAGHPITTPPPGAK